MVTEERLAKVHRSVRKEIDRTNKRQEYLARVYEFEADLVKLIGLHHMEDVSEVSDCVLARFLVSGLRAWDVAHKEELA